MDRELTIARQTSIPNDQGKLLLTAGEPGEFGFPADNAIPTNNRWYLHALRFTFVTGPGGAARIPRIEIRTGATVLISIPANIAQAASLSRTYFYTQAPKDQSAYINNTLHSPLPKNLFLAPATTIRITATNLTINDRFTNINFHHEAWVNG